MSRLDPVLRALLRPFDPALRCAPPAPAEPRLRLKYFGTAGFTLSHAGHTVVIDPYVSRPGAWTSATRRLLPDAAAIERHFPVADDVIVGHAHHDHILDAPDLCRRTGARLIGSPAACMVGRAAGLPEAQLRETRGDEDILSGPLVLRGLPSRHGRVYFNKVFYAGDITAPPPWPARTRELKHGLVLNWHIRAGDLRVVHIDSADFIDASLAGQTCDVLCLCAIGRASRPGYTETAIRLLRPRWVIPCHWDLFFGPLDWPAVELPGCDLAGFVDEIRAAGAEPVVLDFLDELAI